MVAVINIGYLQHGEGNGPFRTEEVTIRHTGNCDHWEARYEGKWRKVHVQVKRTFIVYLGQKITIQIWGV